MSYFPQAQHNIDISIHPDCATGTIRNILGMVNSPRINSNARLEKEKKLFSALAPARVRYHDAPMENPNFALIDISQIFPLAHADADDPANYIFKPTDDYLKAAHECGCPIEYRLGESIDHSLKGYRIQPPDPEKWAEICVHIIRHYNEGWADGLHLGIKYWSIWEEPHNTLIFDGDYSKYLELYEITSKRIKKEFPDLMVGGSNDAVITNMNVYGSFIEHCRKTGSPLDFSAFTIYQDQDHLVNYANQARRLLDENGFKDTELAISEFHIRPLDWDMPYKDSRTEQDEIVRSTGGAFIDSALIRLLDSSVDMVYYYCWNLSSWGVTSLSGKPYPVYHAMCMFTEMARCKNRIKVETVNSGGDLDVLAGLTEDGHVKLLLTCYKAAAANILIKIPGYKSCTARTIKDYADNDVDCEELKPDEEGNFPIYFNGGSTVRLLEFSC